MSAIRPAATVVLLRESTSGLEVLLLRRNAAVQFAGGLWVFPGGAIDAADLDGSDDNMAAAKRAAIREAREETGIDIQNCDLQFFAHWTTPEGAVKRYATWFFVTVLPIGDIDIVVDGSEIVEHRWLSAQAAIALHRSRELDMMPPTFITLTELASCHSMVEVTAMYAAKPIIDILPKFVPGENGSVALYPHDCGYESGRVNANGKRHRCYRAEDGWHYECDDFNDEERAS
jgi:8-oxo-dGTP pyrophosphatase MutT (NUDIX family)